MAVRRLAALSAWSIARLAVQSRDVGVERKLAAVLVPQRDAFAPEGAEELQHQRAGEPGGVKGVDAFDVHRILVDRRELHRAHPAALGIGLAAADSRGEAATLP